MYASKLSRNLQNFENKFYTSTSRVIISVYTLECSGIVVYVKGMLVPFV